MSVALSTYTSAEYFDHSRVSIVIPQDPSEAFAALELAGSPADFVTWLDYPVTVLDKC